MEKSKLISSVIANLRLAYGYYFKDFDEEMTLGIIKLYQDNLGEYSSEVLNNAVNEIIKTSKFMPTIADIVEKCEKQSLADSLKVLEVMKNAGYFKNGCNKMDAIQENSNYQKAIMWVTRGVVPNWLKKDMAEYGLNLELSTTSNVKKLEGNKCLI